MTNLSFAVHTPLPFARTNNRTFRSIPIIWKRDFDTSEVIPNVNEASLENLGIFAARSVLCYGDGRFISAYTSFLSEFGINTDVERGCHSAPDSPCNLL